MKKKEADRFVKIKNKCIEDIDGDIEWMIEMIEKQEVRLDFCCKQMDMDINGELLYVFLQVFFYFFYFCGGKDVRDTIIEAQNYIKDKKVKEGEKNKK